MSGDEQLIFIGLGQDPNGKEIVEGFALERTMTSNQFFLLGVAHDSLEILENLEDSIRIARLASSVVTFSCAFLEAGINAILDSVIIGANEARISEQGVKTLSILNDSHGGDMLQKLSTLDKFLILSATEFFSKIDKGAKLYQDTALLFKLRNLIIHPKIYGKSMSEGEVAMYRDESKLIKSLAERFSVHQGDHRNFPDNPLGMTLTKDSARWAIKAAIDFWNDFLAKLPNGFDNDGLEYNSILSYVPKELESGYNFSPRVLFQMKEGEGKRLQKLLDEHTSALRESE